MSIPDMDLPGTKVMAPGSTSKPSGVWGRVRSTVARLLRSRNPSEISPDSVQHHHGEIGEKAAARFLRKAGIKILLRNYRSRYGEIDIVGREEDILVFVEVKARQEDGLQRPGEAVDDKKRRRLILTGRQYLRELGKEVPHRYDVVEVYLDGDHVTQCRHYPAAF